MRLLAHTCTKTIISLYSYWHSKFLLAFKLIPQINTLSSIKYINTGKGTLYLDVSAAATQVAATRDESRTSEKPHYDLEKERNPRIVVITFEEESLKSDRLNQDQFGHTGISCLQLHQ